MKAFKGLREKVYKGEGGFTLIELLIVIIILGILAAVVAFNVAGFLGAGTEESARTERATVQTAIIGGMADNSLANVTSGTITAGQNPNEVLTSEFPAKTGIPGTGLGIYLQTAPHGTWTWSSSGIVTNGTYSGGGVTCTWDGTNMTCV